MTEQEKCPKCGAKMAMAALYLEICRWDDEPYEPSVGAEVKQDFTYLDGDNCCGWICPDCGHVGYVWNDDCRDDSAELAALRAENERLKGELERRESANKHAGWIVLGRNCRRRDTNWRSYEPLGFDGERLWRYRDMAVFETEQDAMRALRDTGELANAQGATFHLGAEFRIAKVYPAVRYAAAEAAPAGKEKQ